MDNFRKRVIAAQNELKAPKGQYNSYGKYSYRSCEDIVEAAKPVLLKYGIALNLTDRVEEVAGRIYVHARAILMDTESNETIESSGFAREPDSKKGMDDSQVTGTASSYARKYALNGLLAIDDMKDADTDEYTNQTKARQNANQTATRKPVKCEVCGGDIVPVVGKNGETVTTDYLLKASRERFGKTLCADCMKGASRK